MTPTPTTTPAPTATPTPAPVPRVDCGSAVTDKSNTGLISDCEILLGMRDTLRGSASLNWSASLPITQWRGVRLGGTPQRVTIVKLQKQKLTGSIPSGIGSLDKLQDLWLYTNELTGPLPADLGNLSNLETLMLSNNNLSGQIPQTLNNLSLKRLWLKGNKFTGCMPANLLEVPDGDAGSLKLPTCADGGSPVVATPTPIPTATPTPGQASSLTPGQVRKANCMAEDVRAAFGDGFTHESDIDLGPYLWDWNGRGWHASYLTIWTSSGLWLECNTVVYVNEDSAYLDFGYPELADFIDSRAFADNVIRTRKSEVEHDGLDSVAIGYLLGEWPSESTYKAFSSGTAPFVLESKRRRNLKR